MRKIVSLSLIGIFLFNVIGYYGVYAGLIFQARSRANYEIENTTYDRTQAITIKIPLALPYPVQNNFERISGNFEFRGEFYKLVEQKYERDTVYLVCLKNKDEKKAEDVLRRLVKQSTGQSPSSNQNAKTLMGFLKDFNPVMEEFVLTPHEVILLELTHGSTDGHIPSHYPPVPTPPPNSIG